MTTFIKPPQPKGFSTNQLALSNSWSFETKETKVFIPNIQTQDNVDFVKIYRLVIDYVNPFIDLQNTIDVYDKNYGVPILLINPENDKHINSYYDMGVVDKLLEGFLSSTDKKDDTGYNWITNLSGTKDLSFLTNNGGSNHSKNMGNIFGRKLIINKVSNRKYQQIYEFTGAVNEHFDSINIGMMLPVYKNNDGKKYTYSLVKKVMFSCDVLTTSEYDKYFVSDYSARTTSDYTEQNDFSTGYSEVVDPYTPT